jgi:hypothetical protein
MRIVIGERGRVRFRGDMRLCVDYGRYAAKWRRNVQGCWFATLGADQIALICEPPVSDFEDGDFRWSFTVEAGEERSFNLTSLPTASTVVHLIAGKLR